MPNPKAWEVEQKYSFTRGFPGQASETAALWCYPGSYLTSNFSLFTELHLLLQSVHTDTKTKIPQTSVIEL